jgi:5-methyltetrahydrofolate--homocysteine methyltransferase
MKEEHQIDVTDAINTLKEDEVLSWVAEQLRLRIDPLVIVSQLTAGLEKLGQRFATGECFIPELIKGGDIFRKAMELTHPVIEAAGAKIRKLGTCLLGTVKGDLHDLGLNLVAIIFASGGFTVVNLGKDVPVARFVEETVRLKPDIVGLSSLLTTTMEVQGEVIEALKTAGVRNTLKVIIGGAPVNQKWADRIGADAYAADAIDGLRKAKALLGKD